MASAAARKRYNQSPRGKEINRAQCARWRAANPEKMKASYRKHDLKRHYGLTPEEWNAMFDAQGRCCAACGTTDPGRKSGEWATDHDHLLDIVRGILCHGCNCALGHAKDSPDRLRMLAKYLEKTNHAKY